MKAAVIRVNGEALCSQDLLLREMISSGIALGEGNEAFYAICKGSVARRVIVFDWPFGATRHALGRSLRPAAPLGGLRLQQEARIDELLHGAFLSGTLRLPGPSRCSDPKARG
jgi:hypothetical protein